MNQFFDIDRPLSTFIDLYRPLSTFIDLYRPLSTKIIKLKYYNSSPFISRYEINGSFSLNIPRIPLSSRLMIGL